MKKAYEKPEVEKRAKLEQVSAARKEPRTISGIYLGDILDVTD